ncbi:nuclear transport factor 2 family protein [Streptacidiphilus neutrinimicus]|uniref:nuclear transport factor 2 family protein n=1 Tax=Streptacidiphilus neutrinimicus TaxID=105420 RepID=UPI00069346A4|nr:nuclear transport factor 2 family protein [Streptacidiphilus neutrinimicus]
MRHALTTARLPGDTVRQVLSYGRLAFVSGVIALFAPGSTPEVALTNVIADGEQVAAEWVSKGVTVNGHVYDDRCLGVFTVRDGKIVSVREYTDTQHVERTLFG